MNLKWIKKIDRYSANTQAIKSVSKWRIILRAYIMQVVIHSVIIVSLILLSSKYILPLTIGSNFGNAIGAVITLIAISPFLWALSLRRIAVKEVTELMLIRKYRGPIWVLILTRIAIAIFYLGLLLNAFFSPTVALIALIIALAAYLILTKK